MQFSAAQIALLINGKLEGNAAVSVDSFGKIEEAKEGQISFLSNPKYEDFLYTTQASIVIINETFELKQSTQPTLIRVPDAYSAFAELLVKYQEMVTQQLSGIEEPSYIAKTAILGEQIYIGAFAYIGENVSLSNNVKLFPGTIIGNQVTIGENSIIHPGVIIYHNCKIGKNVTIHSGSVIGSDGFGFAPQKDGSFKKIPQLGNVILEDFVEVGANTTIDRATIGSTIIRSGVKLDNLIQIGHNVEIGNNTVIAAQTGISGSVKVGSNVMMGGQIGTAGHISIADGTQIAGKSGITKSIKEPNKSLHGVPAIDISSSLRIQAMTRNLPELEKRVKELEKMVSQLLSERVNG